MNVNLNKFIELNSIDRELLLDSLYKDIRELILETICEYMKRSPENNTKIRSIYYRYTDNLTAAKVIAWNICHVKLPDSDLIWLNECLKASFKKKPSRRPVDFLIREQLWESQGKKCPVCGGLIVAPANGHVDHIVPWDYVGDELPNNYQLLCSDCNLHKSNHVAETVKSLVLNLNKED